MKFVTSRENGTLKHIHKLVKQKKIGTRINSLLQKD